MDVDGVRDIDMLEEGVEDIVPVEDGLVDSVGDILATGVGHPSPPILCLKYEPLTPVAYWTLGTPI